MTCRQIGGAVLIACSILIAPKARATSWSYHLVESAAGYSQISHTESTQFAGMSSANDCAPQLKRRGTTACISNGIVNGSDLVLKKEYELSLTSWVDMIAYSRMICKWLSDSWPY